MLKDGLICILGIALAYTLFYFATPPLMDAISGLPIIGGVRFFDVYVSFVVAELLAIVLVGSIAWFFTRTLGITLVIAFGCAFLHVGIIIYQHHMAAKNQASATVSALPAIASNTLSW